MVMTRDREHGGDVSALASRSLSREKRMASRWAKSAAILTVAPSGE